MKQVIRVRTKFSEGRNENIIQSIVQSMNSTESVKVLDVDSGKDTNRTVVTIIGEPSAVIRSAFKGIKVASELIDMNNIKVPIQE